MKCSWCSEDFTVPQKDLKFFQLGTPVFCSVDCLQLYVLNVPRKLESDFKNVVDVVDSLDMIDAVCYSPLLRTSFRSGYECMVAEAMCLAWDWRIRYESHKIVMSRKKTYTPDFFLESKSVWFEVKGEWRNGAKKKFLKAAEMLGPERVILLPSYYRKWFVKIGNKLRQGLL